MSASDRQVGWPEIASRLMLSYGSAMSPRTCRKCNARGHFVGSISQYSRIEYYLCPECGYAWTHERYIPDRPSAPFSVRTRETASPSIDSRADLGTPRTQCPECAERNLLQVHQLNRTSWSFDYFRCRSCGCWWFVPRGENGPATRIIPGYAKASVLKNTAS